jgi:hypothetical protein
MARGLLVLASLLSAPLEAEVDVEGYGELPSVDWYYASSFGTGKYRAGERAVTVLRVPVAWALAAPPERAWSVRLLAPLTLGAVDFGFEDVIEQPLDSVSLATFTPGVEFLVHAGQAWTLRPFATLGGGAEFDGGDRAWIYSAGASASRALPCGGVQCTFGAALTWAGYHSRENGSDDMSSLAVGLDLVASAGAEMRGHELRPGMFLIYRNYLADAGFIFDPIGLEPLKEEWEVGITLNAAREFCIFGYRFSRLGLSYRHSEGLRGLHIVSRFPF